jgi:hypothetical protein
MDAELPLPSTPDEDEVRLLEPLPFAEPPFDDEDEDAEPPWPPAPPWPPLARFPVLLPLLNAPTEPLPELEDEEPPVALPPFAVVFPTLPPFALLDELPPAPPVAWVPVFIAPSVMPEVLTPPLPELAEPPCALLVLGPVLELLLLVFCVPVFSEPSMIPLALMPPVVFVADEDGSFVLVDDAGVPEPEPELHESGVWQVWELSANANVPKTRIKIERIDEVRFKGSLRCPWWAVDDGCG